MLSGQHVLPQVESLALHCRCGETDPCVREVMQHAVGKATRSSGAFVAQGLCAAVLQAHEDRNLARKLTPAEKKEKKMKKLVGEASEGEAPIVTLFRVRDLSHKQLQFKVKVNAEVSRQCSGASCAQAAVFQFTLLPQQCSAPTKSALAWHAGASPDWVRSADR